MEEKRKRIRPYDMRGVCFNMGKLYFDRLEEEENALMWRDSKVFWWHLIKCGIGILSFLGFFYILICILWS